MLADRSGQLFVQWLRSGTHVVGTLLGLLGGGHLCAVKFLTSDRIRGEDR